MRCFNTIPEGGDVSPFAGVGDLARPVVATTGGLGLVSSPVWPPCIVCLHLLS